jgi:hypothetical protein
VLRGGEKIHTILGRDDYNSGAEIWQLI